MKEQISVVVNNRGVERRCGFDVLFVFHKSQIGCDVVPGSCPTAPTAHVDFSSMDINIVYNVHSD